MRDQNLDRRPHSFVAGSAGKPVDDLAIRRVDLGRSRQHLGYDRQRHPLMPHCQQDVDRLRTRLRTLVVDPGGRDVHERLERPRSAAAP
jgi:hypothetical protein